MLFVKSPTRFVSYDTLIVADSPGAIGSLEKIGCVHPHEGCVLVIIKGSVPMFVTVKTQSLFEPYANVPIRAFLYLPKSPVPKIPLAQWNAVQIMLIQESQITIFSFS